MQKIRLDSAENLLDDYYYNEEKYRSVVFTCDNQTLLKVELMQDNNYSYLYCRTDKTLIGIRCVIDNRIEGLYMIEKNMENYANNI